MISIIDETYPALLCTPAGVAGGSDGSPTFAAGQGWAHTGQSHTFLILIALSVNAAAIPRAQAHWHFHNAISEAAWGEGLLPFPFRMHVCLLFPTAFAWRLRGCALYSLLADKKTA